MAGVDSHFCMGFCVWVKFACVQQDDSYDVTLVVCVTQCASQMPAQGGTSVTNGNADGGVSHENT